MSLNFLCTNFRSYYVVTNPFYFFCCCLFLFLSINFFTFYLLFFMFFWLSLIIISLSPCLFCFHFSVFVFFLAVRVIWSLTGLRDKQNRLNWIFLFLNINPPKRAGTSFLKNGRVLFQMREFHRRKTPRFRPIKTRGLVPEGFLSCIQPLQQPPREERRAYWY